MKKLLLLLTLIYSFSFAFRCSTPSTTEYHYSDSNGVNYCYVGTSLEYVGSGSINNHYADIGGSPDNPQFGKNVAGLKYGNPFYWIVSGYLADCSDTSKCANGNTYDPDNGGCTPECTSTDISNNAPSTDNWVATDYDPGSASACQSIADNNSSYIDSDYRPTPVSCNSNISNICYLKVACPTGKTYNPTTKVCEDSQYCTENSSYNNSSHQCECNSGYKRVYEQCVPDCSQNAPQAQSSISGWVRYVDVYNTVNECSARASQFPNNNFTFTNYSDSRNCQYKLCDVDELSNDPCITAVSFAALTPPGFVFIETVDSVSECSSQVDGVIYLDFFTTRAFPDCASDKSLYCYLEPNNLDNNDSNTSGGGDNNDTNASGSGSNNDSNTSGNSNTSGVSNNLLKQINNTVHSFYTSTLDSDKYWKKMNNLRFTQRTSNDNFNTDRIVSAINNKKSDLTDTNNKLDKLIGDTTPLDVPDTSSIGSGLTDINGSIPTLDDNVSDSPIDTDSITNTTLSAYDDFASKTEDKITSMLSSIDFGIIDLFNVQTVSFVDIPISFNLPVMNTPIEGSLLNANFANSLDFSLGRLAILLGTLIFCLLYTIDRLFK